MRYNEYQKIAKRINLYVTRKGFGENRLSSKDIGILLSVSKHRCSVCKSTDKLSIDHITPLSLGGKNVFSNVQLLCVRCHREKTEAVDQPILYMKRFLSEYSGLLNTYHGHNPLLEPMPSMAFGSVWRNFNKDRKTLFV